MLETSGDGNMKSLGKIRYFILAAITIFSFFNSSNSQDSYYYYFCSYANNSFGTDILVSKVDLHSKEIAASTTIPIRGELQFKKPIMFSRGPQNYYCVLTLNGLPAKNAQISSSGLVTNYAILNEELGVILIGSIPDIQILDFIYSQEGDIEIKILRDQTQQTYRKKAKISIRNNNRLNLTDEIDDPWIDENYPIISGFRYFKKIENGNQRQYWNVTFEGTYLLSLDIENNILLDSMNVESNFDHFHLFGLSPNDSVTYVFNMNSNMVGGPQHQKKLAIDPSYVRLFDSYTFSQLDSFAIPYPPLDSGYVGGSIGPIDRVGDYFVYFDFNGEDFRYFSPAMLFIFDTRTNEATWLRVGWR